MSTGTRTTAPQHNALLISAYATMVALEGERHAPARSALGNMPKWIEIPRRLAPRSLAIGALEVRVSSAGRTNDSA